MIVADAVTWWTYTQGGLTLIVALVAATIAFLAWTTNQEKLRLDLYDRRLNLCEQLRKLAFAGAYDLKDYGSTEANTLSDLATNFRFLFGREIEQKVEQIAATVSTIGTFRYCHDEDKTQKRDDKGSHEQLVSSLHKLRDEVDQFIEIVNPFLDFHNIGARRGTISRCLKSVVAWTIVEFKHGADR